MSLSLFFHCKCFCTLVIANIQQGHLFYFPQVHGYYLGRYLILQLGYVIDFALQLVVCVRTWKRNSQGKA